jgi:flagellar hook-length control protein FliK
VDAAAAAVTDAAPAPTASAPGAGASPAFALPAHATPAPGGAPTTGAAEAVAWRGELPAPVGTDGFAPGLGAQLVAWVRDGIEQAHLRLNPAELGPVDVMIRLDGTQAQVDFAAAQAGTRQALQDAVPVLAGTLRDAGFTLAGGGVFEQPRDARPDGGPPGREAAAGRGEAAAPGLRAAVPAAARARGVVDLYA